jgi:ferredoxin
MGPGATQTIEWPNGSTSQVEAGRDWLEAAREAGVLIPTGCLGGSCGACEIEVNGRVLRACVSQVPPSPGGRLRVSLAVDPYW